VRILVDANLSPRVTEALTKAGYDATHVRDHGLLSASDEQILEHAQGNGQVIVSADTDFTTMLALRGLPSPSLVLLRSADHLAPISKPNCSWPTSPRSLRNSNQGLS